MSADLAAENAALRAEVERLRSLAPAAARHPELNDREWLAERYVGQGMTLAEIGALFEPPLSDWLIRKSLDDAGIARRSRGPRPRVGSPVSS